VKLRFTSFIPIIVAPLTIACGQSGQGTQCNCPVSELQIIVPSDRVSDVKSIDGTSAACSGSAQPSTNGTFFLNTHGPGICHVKIVFRSGAAEFDADAQLTQCTDHPCCSICGATAAQPVIVPSSGADASI
jgi:hypothetical protein